MSDSEAVVALQGTSREGAPRRDNEYYCLTSSSIEKTEKKRTGKEKAGKGNGKERKEEKGRKGSTGKEAQALSGWCQNKTDAWTP